MDNILTLVFNFLESNNHSTKIELNEKIKKLSYRQMEKLFFSKSFEKKLEKYIGESQYETRILELFNIIKRCEILSSKNEETVFNFVLDIFGESIPEWMKSIPNKLNERQKELLAESFFNENLPKFDAKVRENLMFPYLFLNNLNELLFSFSKANDGSEIRLSKSGTIDRFYNIILNLSNSTNLLFRETEEILEYLITRLNTDEDFFDEDLFEDHIILEATAESITLALYVDNSEEE